MSPSLFFLKSRATAAPSGGTWYNLQAGYTGVGNKITNPSGTRQAVVKSMPSWGAVSGAAVLDMTPPSGSSSYFGANLVNTDATATSAHWTDGSDANYTLDWPGAASAASNQGFGRVRIIDQGAIVGEYEPNH